jgi:hypothetical protein
MLLAITRFIPPFCEGSVFSFFHSLTYSHHSGVAHDDLFSESVGGVKGPADVFECWPAASCSFFIRRFFKVGVERGEEAGLLELCECLSDSLGIITQASLWDDPAFGEDARKRKVVASAFHG